jgi:hypothetical protein
MDELWGGSGPPGPPPYLRHWLLYWKNGNNKLGRDQKYELNSICIHNIPSTISMVALKTLT